MTREKHEQTKKLTARGNFGAKFQTFKVEPKALTSKNEQKNKENYTTSEEFGEIRECKKLFLTGFIEGLLLNKESKVAEVIAEHQRILETLHKQGKIDIFELNMLESLNLKLVEKIKYYLVNSDAIAVGFPGGTWKI